MTFQGLPSAAEDICWAEVHVSGDIAQMGAGFFRIDAPLSES